jgi:iron complex transport system ATP-binding protein
MLTASDLWFGYDERTPVLRGVSLTVPADGLVGILGPNGSGKTTLLRMLAGTRRPQRGAVALDGAPLTGFSRAALARRMAVVPQETQLAFDYTVAEVAMMGRYPHLGAFEIEGPRDIAVIDESLAATGTLQLKDRPYATLSGGEKQRVVIAAALAQIFRLKAEATGTDSRGFRLQAEEASSYLLLDEPTASLDLGYQLEIADLLKRLHAERRAAIVISTHDLTLAATLCERLVLVRDGAVLADGLTDEVLTPENLRKAYDVEAEVTRHASGHRLVVPMRRTAPGRPQDRATDKHG